MKIAYVDYNDVNNSIDGTTISVWVQGCPHRCKGCHNPETWDFDSEKVFCTLNNEKEYNNFLKENISEKINLNNIKRNVSILGGEPLATQNEYFTFKLIHYVRKRFPGHKIYLWTGYSMKQIKEKYKNYPYLLNELYYVDYIITDRFHLDERNVELKLRGSNNQHIWTSKRTLFGRKFIDITKDIDNRK